MTTIAMFIIANLSSIIAVSFAGYIILEKGYINGVGWLLFVAVIGSASMSTTRKSEK